MSAASQTVDTEIDEIKKTVSCAVVLERLGGWKIDATESTRRALKYRRGRGEIIIVNHDGHGWWNPTGTERGDCFALVQHLLPGTNFGHVRKMLRELAGLSPTFPDALRVDKPRGNGVPAAERWQHAKPLSRHGPAWRYLAKTRRLPSFVLDAAASQDTVRQGSYGTPWFAHRDHTGYLTGIDARGPDFRGFLSGGDKSLFRLLRGRGNTRRLAITEAPIDALSLAAIEIGRADTLYVATTGGIGPGTADALRAAMADMVSIGGTIDIATDNDKAGHKHAATLSDLASVVGATPTRLLPFGERKDWNEILKLGEAESE